MARNTGLNFKKALYKIKEAKELKNHYLRLKITDECWCDQTSHSECPKHIEAYIESLERHYSITPNKQEKGE